MVLLYIYLSVKSPAVWAWQYLFPSQRLSRHRRDPENATLYRFHCSPSTVGKVIKAAAAQAGLTKRIIPHILRHSFAVYLRKRGVAIKQIQKLMGHKSDRTTQYHYLRSIEPDIDQIKGPLDYLLTLLFPCSPDAHMIDVDWHAC